MEIAITVTFDVSGADRLAAFLGGGDVNGAMTNMLHQWGARYLAFTRRRFVQHSRGGGDWKPLAPSTIRARRAGKVKRVDGFSIRGIGKAKTKAGQIARVRRAVAQRQVHSFTGDAIESAIMGSAAILRDTGVLLNALSPGTPENLLQPMPGELKVRCGVEALQHSPGSKATIQQIAGFHQGGGANGRPPQRVIFAAPDETTVAGMQHDLWRAMSRAASGGRQ